MVKEISIKEYLEGIKVLALPLKAQKLIEKLLETEGIDVIGINSDNEYKRVIEILDGYKITDVKIAPEDGTKEEQVIDNNDEIKEPKNQIYPTDNIEFYYQDFPYGIDIEILDNSPQSILYKAMQNAGATIEQVQGNYPKYKINGIEYGILDNGGEFKIDNITDNKTTFAQIDFSDYKNDQKLYDENSVTRLVNDLVKFLVEDSKKVKQSDDDSGKLSERDIKKLQIKIRAYSNSLTKLEGKEKKKMEIKIRALENSIKRNS